MGALERALKKKKKPEKVYNYEELVKEIGEDREKYGKVKVVSKPDTPGRFVITKKKQR